MQYLRMWIVYGRVLAEKECQKTAPTLTEEERSIDMRTLRLFTVAITGLFLALAPLGAEAQNSQSPEDAARERVVNEVIGLVRDSYIRVLTAEELTELRNNCIIALESDEYMRDCMAQLDPHTRYVTPEALDEFEDAQRPKSFGGVGIVVRHSDDPPGIMVVDIIEGGPSERLGIKAGDVIVEIADESGEMLSTADMMIEETVDLMRGAIGSTVRIKVKRVDEETLISFTITRETIKPKLVYKELKPDGIGYVRLENFGRNATQDIEDALFALVRKNNAPLSGLVLDMRYNLGGLLYEADGVNDLFLTRAPYTTRLGFDEDAATTVQIEARGVLSDYKRFVVGPSGDVLRGAPIVILVNGVCASACELVAKTLQMHGRAIVAGVEKTFGKGTTQSSIPLRSGGKLLLTTYQYVIGPRGCEEPVQGVGVIPDIFLKRAEGEDPIEFSERTLPHAIGTSGISNANCQYHFSVPPAHFDATRRMLGILGLEPIVAPPQE